MAGNAEHKVRENRLRRMAERQGLRLEKSRRRDPNAWDYGTWQLTDARTNAIVAQNFAIGQGYGLSLDDIEERLTQPAGWWTA
jgi:hypothetical protein